MSRRKTVTTITGKVIETRTTFRYVILDNDSIVLRTDSLDTVTDLLRINAHMGWTFADTEAFEDIKGSGNCRVCDREVMVVLDYKAFGAHWNCMTAAEHADATAAFHAARA